MSLHPTPLSVVRVKQLVALLSLSKSSVYERFNPRSSRYEASFPKPLKIGNATCFLVHEIEAYILSKANARSNKVEGK